MLAAPRPHGVNGERAPTRYQRVYARLRRAM